MTDITTEYPEDKTLSLAQNEMIKSKSVLGKLGGAYIPPARLASLQRSNPSLFDKSGEAFQKISWEALKKSINGLINKVNTSNIKNIIIELFSENLIRGRGLFCRSILKAQSASLPFTPVFASLVAVINSKIPLIGELLLTRLILQFRRAFRRNDKTQCLASVTFLAHLVNQQVIHEIVALELLTLLLEKPTDDSVEIAVGFCRECGAKLSEISPKPMNVIFERFRAILIEANIDVRIQWMIQVLFQVRKDKFKDNPSVKEELDLVDEDDRITHYISLDDEFPTDDGLVVFRYDPNFIENEAKYAAIKQEILGDTTPEDLIVEKFGEESLGNNEDGSDKTDALKELEVKDRTNMNLINLRKTIYLTIMSSLGHDETTHKLLKMNIPEGHEIEMVNMLVECCSQEKTYSKFYGNICERFCQLNPLWMSLFEQCFNEIYQTIHRLETNRIRNIATLFAHLLFTDAISWINTLSIIHLNENETSSASRIFIKILFLEISEVLGSKKLIERLNDPLLKTSLTGLFPKDNPRDTRFAINYFTAIGLGVLTDDLRDHLKQLATQVTDSERPATTSQYEQSPKSPSEELTIKKKGNHFKNSSDSDSDSDSDIEENISRSSSDGRETSHTYARSHTRSRSPTRHSHSHSHSDRHNDSYKSRSERHRYGHESPTSRRRRRS